MARLPEIRELEIEKVAPGGRGVAFVDDGGERRAVFVPLAAPGDRVRAEVDFEARPARGRTLEMLAQGPGRIEPPCSVAARCGGCDFMHLTPEAQRAAHEAILREALPKELRDVAIAVHEAPTDARYRARTRLHVEVAKNGHVAVGFMGTRSHDLVETDECLVLAPTLEAARKALAGWLVGAKGRGEARLALGAFPERKPVLDLSWNGELPPAFFGTLERVVKEGVLAGARVVEEGANRPALLGAPAPWMQGADGDPLQLAPGGFGQASDEGNMRLGQRIGELLDVALPDPTVSVDAAALSVVELFAGAGNFTALLAARGAKITAVESDAPSCEAARENLKARGLASRAKVVTQDADAFLVPRATRLVLLDPPRAGARGAIKHIVEARVNHVLYVSCDPPSLARDLGALAEAGYAVSSLDLFELFPQTSHVETITHLVLDRAASRGARERARA